MVTLRRAGLQTKTATGSDSRVFMSHKIKYETERNGELKDFPLMAQSIVLPNGVELSL